MNSHGNWFYSLGRSLVISALLTFVMFGFVGCGPIQKSAFGEQTYAAVPTNFVVPHESAQTVSVQGVKEEQIQFAVFTDSHANYSDLKKVAKRIQNDSTQFAVNLGDMTDLGLAVEYDAFLRSIQSLKKPLLTIIGNHDAVGNGKAIYQRLFGVFNHSYEFAGHRWIFMNNNRLDFMKEGIDLNWLEQKVSESSLPVLLFQHVNPFNSEYFDQTYLDQYKRILDSGKVRAIFHGHTHVNATSFYNKTLIQSFARVENEQYHRVTVARGAIVGTSFGVDKIQIENCRGDQCVSKTYSFGDSDTVAYE